MEIDFDASEQTHDFVTIPQGRYLCRIGEVRPATTRAGDERWSLRLVVVEGPQIGKQAAWDSIVFSLRGRIRARMVLQAFGLPATGKVQIEPSDLTMPGRHAVVQVMPQSYQAPDGSVVRRNEVPYDGYSAPEQHLQTDPDETGFFPVRSQVGLRGKSHVGSLSCTGMDYINIRFTSGKQQLIHFADRGDLLRFAQDIVRRFGPK